MKVTATIADSSACGYYRVSLPVADLNLHHGWESQVTMQMPWNLEDEMYTADIFVVQRIVDPNISAFLKRIWRRQVQRPVIYELDDLVTHLHRTNTQAWDYYMAEGRLEIFKDLVSNVDAMTTTTETLAEELRTYCDHVYVLPNCLPNWVTSMVKDEHDGPVRIVYTGGPSHLDDVLKYRYGIGNTIKKMGDAVTLHSYGHPWLKELGLTDEGHVHFRPWTQDFPSYQSSLVDYDVGIAPLKDTRFNRSKSAIKVYEYWAAGIVPVVSDVQPYSEAIEHGVDGFLCRKDEDWRDALRALVEEPELLTKMREAGYARVPGLLMKNNSEQWDAIYREVIERGVVV